MTDEIYRAFTEEFRHHMSTHDGWPPYKVIGAALGMSHTKVAAMYKGRHVPERFATNLIAWIASKRSDPQYHFQFEALLAFVRRFGIESVSSTDTDLIVGHVCDPVVRGRPRRWIDYLSRNIDIVARAPRGLAVDRYVRAPYPADTPQLVEWMFIRVAQCTASTGPTMTDDEALIAAESIIKIERTAYAQTTRQWALAEPWTVAMARRKKGIVGMSIVLPLTEAAYLRVRGGAQASYECRVEDFEVPSRHILIEAAAERPAILGQVNAPEPLFWTVLNQVAALARADRRKKGETIRILTFGGTLKNRERLLRAGYTLIPGARMARTGLELFEREERVGAMYPRMAFLGQMILKELGRLNNSPPRRSSINPVPGPTTAGPK
jgi:hypothetical protein